jgi:hypothetical protein
VGFGEEGLEPGIEVVIYAQDFGEAGLLVPPWGELAALVNMVRV